MSRCYVGRCKCGSIVAAVVAEADWTKDVKDYEKIVAKDVAGFIKDGLTIEQMDSAQVRVVLESCKCSDKSGKQLSLESRS